MSEVRHFLARAGFCLLLLGALPIATGQEDGSGDVPDSAAAYSRKGVDTCLSCHDDEVTLALFRTKHAIPGDARGPFGHGQLQCEACHGPGDAHSGRVRRNQERPAVITFGANDPTPIEQQNGMCLNCHNEDVGFGWHSGAHPVDEVACVSCHDSDDTLAHAYTNTTFFGESCSTCHGEGSDYDVEKVHAR